MKRHLSILLLCCIYSHIYAQTPYDSFSPATSRPILDVMQSMVANKDSLQQTQMDTTLVTPDNVSKWLLWFMSGSLASDIWRIKEE